MNPINNPFSPGAGTRPPELVGRDPILTQGRVLFGRVRNKRSAKSLLLNGLRGVGKTVLLNELRRIAEADSYYAVQIEASEGKALAAALAPQLRNLLFKLDLKAGAGNKLRQAFVALRSFVGVMKLSSVQLGIDISIEPEKGTADSGDLESDLSELFTALGEAAEERGVGVAVLIDEMQYFNSEELGALIVAMHTMQQRQLPVVLVGAGLPTLPGQAGEAKSYSERLFDYPAIGALSMADAAKALSDPARAEGLEFAPEALDEVCRLTHGYPYFVQQWGYQCWDLTDASPITMRVVERATQVAVSQLDASFFRVRYDRTTPAEKKFLRGMAGLGPGPYRLGDIVQVLGVKPKSVSPVRASLIRKGMIYSPQHGDLAFTVPLFNEFMIRAEPDLLA